MKIEILYFDGCPYHRPAVEKVRAVVRQEGVSADTVEVNVRDASMALNLKFLGSPSIRVNGLDVEQTMRTSQAYGMMCRTYPVNGRRERFPSREMLRKAVCEAVATHRGRQNASMHQTPVALDGEEFAAYCNGGDWLTAWYPPDSIPAGTPHGANGLCLTGGDGVVLISRDGERWGWPGGRPEGDESWEQTLRREIVEETCSIVRSARLLGF